jgi:hypothetical protein
LPTKQSPEEKIDKSLSFFCPFCMLPPTFDEISADGNNSNWTSPGLHFRGLRLRGGGFSGNVDHDDHGIDELNCGGIGIPGTWTERGLTQFNDTTIGDSCESVLEMVNN